METVKIKTNKGRIITLTIEKRTNKNISGIDKFGEFLIIPYDEIYKLTPIETKGGEIIGE